MSLTSNRSSALQADRWLLLEGESLFRDSFGPPLRNPFSLFLSLSLSLTRRRKYKFFKLLSENKLIICTFVKLHYQILREKF